MKKVFTIPFIILLLCLKSYSQEFDINQHKDELTIEYYNSLKSKSKYEKHIRAKDFKVLETEFIMNAKPIIRYSMPKFREYHITYSTSSGESNTVRTLHYEIESYQHWKNRFITFEEWKTRKTERLQKEFEEKKKIEVKRSLKKSKELNRLDSLKQKVKDLNIELFEKINKNLLSSISKSAIYSLNYKIFNENNSRLSKNKEDYIANIFQSIKTLDINDYNKLIGDRINKYHLGFYNLINWEDWSNLDYKLFYFDKSVSKNVNIKFEYNALNPDKSELPKIIKEGRYIKSYVKLLENILAGNEGNFSFSFNNCFTVNVDKNKLGLDYLFKTYLLEFEKLDVSELQWERHFDHTNFSTIKYLLRKTKKLEEILKINLSNKILLYNIGISNLFNENNCIINFSEFYNSGQTISIANVVYQDFYKELIYTISEKLNSHINPDDKKNIVNLIINSADFKTVNNEFENKILKDSYPSDLYDFQKNNWGLDNIETYFENKKNDFQFTINYGSPINKKYSYSYKLKKKLLYQINSDKKIILE